MARAGHTILDSGQRFPRLEFDTVAHGPLSLPDGLGAGWAVVLLYRAHW